MALSAEQREARRKHVCASDVAPILGCHLHRSDADVWAEKVFGLEDQQNDAQRAGSLLESSVLDWAELELACPLARDVMVVSHSDPLFAANLDGQTARGEPVEAKTAGIVGPDPRAGDWGEPGTDEVPEPYLLQVQSQLLVTEAAVGYLAALLGGRGFVMYRIEANAAIQQAIRAQGHAFWDKHVATRVRPAGRLPAMEILKRIKRDRTRTRDIAVELVERVELAKQDLSAAEIGHSVAVRALVTAMDDGELARFPGGEVQYPVIHRKAYQAEASSYRRLTIKRDKPPKEHAHAV